MDRVARVCLKGNAESGPPFIRPALYDNRWEAPK